MKSWARISAGFGSRTRAAWHLTLGRGAYRRGLAQLPTISGPALVVGSAPEPNRPAGLDSSWFVISINASQITAERFGIDHPNLTIFRDGIMLPGIHQGAVWRALPGRRTGHLLATMGSTEDAGIAGFIVTQGFQADRVTELNRHLRGAVILDMSGRFALHLGGRHGISNGMFAVLLALKLGAGPVVMSGFSFGSGWDFDKSLRIDRGHVAADLAVCQAILRRGLPVFTADPAFANQSGLPLWGGPAPG